MWLAPMFRNRPGRDPNQPRWKFTVLALVAVTSILALLPFIYTGIYSRFQADDYCSAQLLRSTGFLNAQWEFYTGWSNRFSTMFMTGLIDPLDVLGMQILPTILVVGLLLCGYYLLHTLRNARGWSLSDLEILAMAGVITFISVYSAPNAFQSIYWRSGSITYTLPILGFLILAAILVSHLSKNPTGWKVILIGLLAFFNGGFSETTAVMQSALLGMAAGWILWRVRTWCDQFSREGHPMGSHRRIHSRHGGDDPLAGKCHSAEPDARAAGLFSLALSDIPIWRGLYLSDSDLVPDPPPGHGDPWFCLIAATRLA